MSVDARALPGKAVGEITSGQSSWLAGRQPCDPFTSVASSGTTSINMRKPSFFWSSRHPIFAFAARGDNAGSRNSSTGS